MAVDSRDKRASILGLFLAVPAVLPSPAGAITEVQFEGLAYCYAGIQAGIVADTSTAATSQESVTTRTVRAVREVYRLTTGDPQGILREANAILGRIGDRLDLAEGVRGAPTVHNDLTVEGTVTGDSLAIAGDTTSAGGLTLTGLLSVGGATSLGSTLTVAGATALSGALSVAGGTTLSGTLGATGAVSLASSLTVTGAVTGHAGATLEGVLVGELLGLPATEALEDSVVLQGALATTGQVAVGAALTVAGHTVLGEDLDITGYLRLSGGPWEDLRFPAQSINPTGITGAAGMDTTETGFPGTLLFDAATPEMCAGVAQLPHGWRIGSSVRPHVHWAKTSSAAGTVIWLFYYRVASVGGTFGAWQGPVTGTHDVSDSDTANKHALDSFGDISMTGHTESCIMAWRVYRDAATDTYAADARLFEFDIHYQVQKLGTESEYPAI